MTLTTLPSIVTVASERPDVGGGPDHPMRRVTSDTAFAPASATNCRPGSASTPNGLESNGPPAGLFAPSNAEMSVSISSHRCR